MTTQRTILIALGALCAAGCGTPAEEQPAADATFTRTSIIIKNGVATTTEHEITREQQLAELPAAIQKELGVRAAAPTTRGAQPNSTWFRDDCVYSNQGFRMWDQYGFVGNELCIWDDGSGAPVHLASVVRTGLPRRYWYGYLKSWSTTRLPYYQYVDFIHNGKVCDTEPYGWSWNSSGCQQTATDINVRTVIP